MASKAYLNALKEIPEHVQNDVIGSLEIANEIHLILEQKHLCAADLARMLNKSESEVSKWLTGLHNFTFKTVRKISKALEVDLVVTQSSKITEYEVKIETLQDEIKNLKRKVNPNFAFDESLNFTVSSINLKDSDSVNDGYLANFIQNDVEDLIKIKPATESTFSVHVAKD
ncbi:helix-turn-helix transcriptional regulator [Algibacter sp. 2305UL17-15]|uniref:helix-turn-helix domain-containing protein n=1 Tax=Algibacter sp. 2305UL17-15 TaxID=3231268 RepID=UPI00345967B9